MDDTSSQPAIQPSFIDSLSMDGTHGRTDGRTGGLMTGWLAGERDYEVTVNCKQSIFNDAPVGDLIKSEYHSVTTRVSDQRC